MFSNSEISGIFIKALILVVGIFIFFSLPIIPTEWVMRSVQNESSLEASEVPSFSNLSKQIAPNADEKEMKCMTELMAQTNNFKDATPLKQGGPEDEVILRMLNEGKSDCEIMKFVFSISKGTRKKN